MNLLQPVLLPFSIATALTTALATALPGQSPGATFDALPLPAGTYAPAGAEECSADGSVVVGYAATPGAAYEAMQWDSTGGHLLAPLLANGPVPSYAMDVTPNGLTIAGNSKSQVPGWTYLRWRACVWHSGVPVDLGSAPGIFEQDTVARAISADGSAVAGWVIDPASQARTATRFNSTGGAQLLGALPGSTHSEAWDLSFDGGVVVGTCSGGHREGFVWTSTTGMVGLGANSDACCVTADGSIVAGTSTLGEAGYWTQATGWVSVGMPYGTLLHGISDDGRLIVGTYSFAGGSDGYVWTASGGTRLIQTILADDHGVGLNGFDIDSILGLSGDGEAIVGTGVTNGQSHAFRIHLDRDGWSDLGHSLPGATGAPHLYCRGSLRPGTVFATECVNLPSHSFSALVLGFHRTDLPLLTGLLVPSPDIAAVLPPRGNQPSSRATVSGFPSFAANTELFVQQWVLDATGPQGATATRAMSGVIQ